MLQCLTHIKMADNIVPKEPLDNPFYVHPLHAKVRIVINVLNILHKPRARTELNYDRAVRYKGTVTCMTQHISLTVPLYLTAR
jgi:hypothetical protein